MSKPFTTARFCWLLGIGWIVGAGFAMAQPTPASGTPVLLNDLSAFKPATQNWQIVGNVRADLGKPNVISTEKGTGILANVPLAKAPEDPKNPTKYNLFTTTEHGDIDLELDYMIIPKSNSGIYLQGRYEIQLFDSWDNTGWDVRSPRTVDNGSIYERWDPKRPEGQNGYDGHPARQNASRAPGLWQHLKIAFQAPRFNANGQKTANARMLRVELNGVVIHDDVELSGPTRGAAFDDEKPLGPLMLQGDHGAVAFRNIRYTSYDKARPELANLKYSVYKGKFTKNSQYDKTAPESEGPTTILSSSISRIPNDFLIRYTGTIRVQEPGEYSFNLSVPGGEGMLKINNQSVVAPGSQANRGKVTLPKGDLPLELLYYKTAGWFQPALGLSVAGPGIREFLISDPIGTNQDDVDPILVDASTNTLLRSFMDMPGDRNTQGKRVRVTHAISVGSPAQVHYTYDLDKGAMIQIWRGLFLDATPMWHDRGDGSSRPMGMVQRLGTPVLFLATLASPQANWPTDTTNSSYRPKGYVLDGNDLPTFRYQSYGSMVDDKIRVLESGQGVRRELTVATPASNLYARLASGSVISPLENGMYLIDGQAYLRIDDTAGAKPIVRESNGQKELLVPVKGKLTYSILF